MSAFNIFAEESLREHIDSLQDSIKKRVLGETPQYLLNVNRPEYVEHLVEEYRIEPLAVDVANQSASSREVMVAADRHPKDYFFQDMNKKYARQCITFHLPVTGDLDLLRMQPDTRLMTTRSVSIVDGYICFDIIDFRNDAGAIKQEADQIVRNITAQAGYVMTQVSSFNNALSTYISRLIEERKQTLGKQNQLLAGLGVPIRKSSNTPSTFAIPSIRKKISPKPVVHPNASKPVPTLDDGIYKSILKVIFDMGRVFERHPSTYAGKDEENLRDHLIMQLEPHFEGSTTGETFNKSGKTDILIRHDKGNVFVGECKFWSGKVKHAATITQLLSYLTWRDSKTALIYFVKRKEIVQIIEEIKNSTKSHENFLRVVEDNNHSWLMFEMHLPGDKDCKVQMAVLAFHLPE